MPEQILEVAELGAVHFVGIGGAGLSAIARLMLARGVAVSGSDGADSPAVRALGALGARVFVGHRAEHVHGADTLVVSTAVAEDNPELVEATRLGLRIWPRSAGLAALMAGQLAICVAGTHGKTTTTSLLTVALQEAGADPTYAVGAELAQTGLNAGLGAGELFVAEADESDGAFLVYAPHVGVVVNVEADHLDQWGSEAAYRAGFEDYADHVAPDGFLVCGVDDPGAAALARRQGELGRAVVRVGLGAEADLRAVRLHHDGTHQRFEVERDGVPLGEVALQITGEHYVVDALAALAAGLGLGYDFAALAAGMAGFGGARRRMELLGEADGVRVYDSYAHHPTEIDGDLRAARTLAGDGRVVVGYQPHLVSRTRLFGAAMGQALGAADEVVVTDVYLAREPADPAVTGALVAAACPLPGEHVRFVPDLGDVASVLAGLARPGDLVLTLGAGTITTAAPAVLAALAGRAGRTDRAVTGATGGSHG